MATWAELLTEIYSLTNRPDRVAETNLALRQAVRLAHKSGKFWRDLVSTTVTLPVAQVQEIDIASWAPNFRGVATLGSATNELAVFNPVTIDDLLDSDNYARTNVYWGIGTKINIRAANPEELYTLRYYKYPIVFPTASFNSWIADQHADLLILWAAASVLGSLGENDIRDRLNALALVELRELQNSNIEIVGR